MGAKDSSMNARCLSRVIANGPTRSQNGRVPAFAWLASMSAISLSTLTGVLNRRFFDETLLAECKHGQAANGIFSLIIFDLDHFKKVNDSFGHPEGDKVLQQV